MESFRVSLEVTVQADNHMAAAEELESCIKAGDRFVYYVQGYSDVVYSVDLEESSENAILVVNDYSPIIKS